VEDNVLVTLWSPKGGSGTSVFAAACALALARPAGRRGPDRAADGIASRLVDLDGDQPAVFALASEPGTGVADWLASGPDAPSDALDRLAVDVTSTVTLLPRGTGAGVLAPPAAAEAGAALAVALRDGPVPTIVDAGRADTPAARALVEVSDVSLVVLRACYLALRRTVHSPLLATAAGAVVVAENQSSLQTRDVSEVLTIPVVASVPWLSTTARLVDAGVFGRRAPESVLRPARDAMRAVGALGGRRGAAA
jgi:hypothetical protein